MATDNFRKWVKKHSGVTLPQSPKEGAIRYNAQKGANEIYTPGGTWRQVSPKRIIPNYGKSKADWEKEFGLGASKQ
jgi:hypothetical protein